MGQSLARVVLSLGLGGFISLGCEHERVEESATQELRLDAETATVVDVRVGDGSVLVASGQPGVIEVVFTNRARAADSAGARALVENIRTEAVQDGDVVRVRARARAGGAAMLGGSAWSEVSLRIPPDSTELDIRIDDGRIELRAVAGTIRAETGDGRIRVEDLGGKVTLRTNDGSITGTNLSGDFDARTDDGRIRLDGSFGKLRAVTGDGSIRVTGRDMTSLAGEWSLRSSDGSIELTLPKELNANLDASSGDGRIINNLSHFDGRERRNRIHGTIGSGGARILVTTMDGRIVLNES